MKKILSIIIILIITLSCNNIQKGKVERENEPDIIGVKSDDSEMNLATEKAKLNIEYFDLALKSNNPKFNNISVKQPYKTESGSEHIWISDIILKEDKYLGIIGNTPEYTSEVKLGDTVLVEKSRISDWMYIEENKLRGGYTIRALRSKMSESEKKQFDNDNGLIIEDEK
jgi:uncharacterized protein YegJ (DUF2314 family)